eukprot:7389496-Prymnesium_polylepis.1
MIARGNCTSRRIGSCHPPDSPSTRPSICFAAALWVQPAERLGRREVIQVAAVERGKGDVSEHNLRIPLLAEQRTIAGVLSKLGEGCKEKWAFPGRGRHGQNHARGVSCGAPFDDG